MCCLSHTHTRFLHLFLSDWGGQHALSVSTGTPLSADQKLWSRYDGEPLNRSAHYCIFHFFPFSSLLLIFFFISPAGSWISQEQQLHYQPEMYSSILLLPSDKGTARQVTRAHRELCGKQHFSSCSAVLHANDGQMAVGENHSWFAWRPWLHVITLQSSVCGIWYESSQMKTSSWWKHVDGKERPYFIRAVINVSLILRKNQMKSKNLIFKFHRSSF